LGKAIIMKTILVATDFSQAAQNACLYAMELARAFNAGVILVSAYQQLPVPVTEVPVILSQEDMGRYVKEQLEQEAALVNRAGIMPLETVSMEGVASSGILKTAKDYNADIIIVGMKEAGKGIRKMFGSTVTTLARRTTIPLIVVPAGASYANIDAIALANESDIDPESNVHLLDALGEITTKFASRLYLVRVAEKGFREAYEANNRPAGLQRKLWNLQPEYKCIEGKDIPRALNRFISCYHINMLALMPHQHSLLESWFVKSTTRAVIFDTSIPLLVLPGRRSEEAN